jgi:hypothetical protein
MRISHVQPVLPESRYFKPADVSVGGRYTLRICDTTQRDADARLIAAAPEMLAVLSELSESAAYWSEYDVPLGIVDRINSAIAKATGGAS